ncbi:MAG: branched-chain amino acid ABC transporter permease [Pikeienuella sp.]
MDFGPFLLLALMEGTVMAAVLALTAVGLSLVFGVMRVVNVAHGEFFMLGAVIAWWVGDRIGGAPVWGFAAALILAPLMVGALAVIADRLVLSRLNYDPERTIVATIGLLYILQQTALTSYGPDARPVEAPFSHRIYFPWFGYSSYKFFVIVAAAMVLGGVWALMTRTKLGLILRASRMDAEMARAFGVDVKRAYALTFGLGAALAALAAALVAPIQQAHYLMGGDPLLLSFITVIIGGLGSIPGTVVAALLIGMSDGIISIFFVPSLAKILATLLVAFVLIFRPQGLFGARAG